MVRAAVGEELDRRREGATGGEHRVEHVALPALRSSGSRSAYVTASSVSSSRAIPRNPTSAVGSSRIIPSSIPSPARRIGTTSGLGAASLTPVVGATGVTMSTGSTRTSRVAS